METTWRIIPLSNRIIALFHRSCSWPVPILRHYNTVWWFVSYIIHILGIIEGSLEAKLPTIWTDGKALQLGRSSDVEKMRKGEDAGARESREVAKHCVFSMSFNVLWLRGVEK